MDREILAKVFEPFFTTKELGRGTGLGLATVYGILKQNKGQINIYSEPGRGTTVKMYLPEYRDDPVQDLQGDSLDTGRRSVGSVLLVEDSRINLEVTTRMLGVLGHEVVSTQSPEEALKIVTEKTRHFDVLLTDVVMPGMNGRDLSRLIGETCPGIACVFMSGYTANVIAHQGILDENVFFLQKPFSMWQLEKSMQTAMNRKALQ